MRALSLHQPWATFVARGWKTIETRSWGTGYRGPVAICAAKARGYVDDDDRYARDLLRRAAITPPFHGPLAHAFGAIVAVADLVECFRVGTEPRKLDGRVYDGVRVIDGYDYVGRCVPAAEFVLGDLSVGRYAWVLENVRALDVPVPVRGYQGLWTLDPALAAAAERALDADERTRFDGPVERRVAP